MTTTVLDFETRSEADLKKVGTWSYAEHPSTEIICVSWRDAGSKKAHGWLNPAVDPRSKAKQPTDLLKRARRGDLFEAHKADFEYSIWHCVGVKRLGWPEIPIPRWRDSMAVACYYSMPPALDKLAKALGLPGKDPAGARLITKYCKLYLKTAKREIPPEDLDAFMAYCHMDVEQEDDVGELLGELPEQELEYFLNDFEVNARGLMLNKSGIMAAQLVVDLRAGELAREFEKLVGYKPTQRDRIMDWLYEHNLYLPNLTADTIDELLDEGRIAEEPVPWVEPEVRRALELRRQHAKASTKKLDAMLRQRGTDGRARFQTRYHGAVSGRNTGTGFQPLNLKRGFENVPPKELVYNINIGSPKWLDCLYGDAMDAVSKALRHYIVPDTGNRIIAGDFSSIEAVVNACIASEEWKVQLFRDGGDPYVAFASKVVGRQVLPKKHPDCTSQDILDRQEKGKPGELAGGYQGWVGAWRKFDRSNKFTDDEVATFMRNWREMHPNIVEQWYALDDAAIEAVSYPGRVTGWRDQEIFERVDGWLTMILPDGKRLWYWAPQLRMAWPSWHRPDENEICAAGECDCEQKLQVTYMAQKEGRWKRVYSYGGKWTENRVQAISRQILKRAEMRAKRYGYPQVLGVYDEVVAEVPIGRGSTEDFREILTSEPEPWYEDWPIRASVWEGLHYRK